MKKYLYILATMFIGATAFTGCSSDDNATAPTPSPTPAEETDVVDLGLTSGTLWATANLGATVNYETGNLYAWGETYTKSEFSASNYFDPSSSILKSNISGTDYDAAKVALGGEWVMPTAEQFEELFDECKVTRTTLGEEGNEVKVLKLVGPNENVLYIPEITASVTNAGTLYDSYIDEKGNITNAKFENVYAAYWTGDIADVDEALNANQYAKQGLYVEHAKDAVKKGGEQQYGAVAYNRSRLAGAPIRPVKASGGTPVSAYVDVTGIWAECDASGNLKALSEQPSYITFDGTNYSGKGVSVNYGESYDEISYTRNINDLNITDGNGVTGTFTVADVTTVKKEATGDEETEELRVISLTANGQTKYFIEAEESPAVKVADLAGKWDITYNSTDYVLNILDGSNCVITNSTGDKESATFNYRFGTISFNSTSLEAVFAVVANEGAAEDECPFQFVSGETTITPTVHPKEYEVIYSWDGITGTDKLPSWMIFSAGNKNSVKTGSNIKEVKNVEGVVYTYAIQFNASWPSTSNSFEVTTVELSIEGGFKTGDRIRVKGYTNAENKNGGLKVWKDADNPLGVTAPAVNDLKKKESVMDKESIYTFSSDIDKVYICREQGTGTFITDIYIDREKED